MLCTLGLDGGRLVWLGYRMAMLAVVVAGCMSDCAPCELSGLFWMDGEIDSEGAIAALLLVW